MIDAALKPIQQHATSKMRANTHDHTARPCCSTLQITWHIRQLLIAIIRNLHDIGGRLPVLLSSARRELPRRRFLRHSLRPRRLLLSGAGSRRRRVAARRGVRRDVLFFAVRLVIVLGIPALRLVFLFVRGAFFDVVLRAGDTGALPALAFRDRVFNSLLWGFSWLGCFADGSLFRD